MNNLNITIFDSRLGSFLVCFNHPFTKRKVRKSFKSKLEAHNYKENILKRFSINRISSYNDLNVEDALILFMDEKPKNVFSKKDTHLIDFYETFKDVKIQDLTNDALKVWLNQIQKENKVRDTTMRGIKCELDTLFVFLENKEIISESPLKEIFYAKYVPNVKARNILSSNELLELLGEIKKYSPGYLYPLILFFSETAAKTSEVVDLTWENFDLDNQIVKFNKGINIQTRTLRLSSELTKSLRTLKVNSKADRVFQTYYKENFTTKKIILAIKEFKEKSEFKKNWCPMDLRHSFAVNFLSEGRKLNELQRILGHQNIHDTKRLYGEVAIEFIKEKTKLIAV